MATFKTAEPDREWRIRLTVGLCDTIKRDLGIDIGGAIQDAEKFAAVLFAEPGKLVSVLWLCCEKQATEARITPEGFACLFDGDVLDSAVAALLEGVVDFFPKARGRAAIKSGLPRVMKQMATAADKAINEKLSTLYEPAGSTPESAESIPAT